LGRPRQSPHSRRGHSQHKPSSNARYGAIWRRPFFRIPQVMGGWISHSTELL
jgi:hypothetical protein